VLTPGSDPAPRQSWKRRHVWPLLTDPCQQWNTTTRQLRDLQTENMGQD